MPFKRKLTQKQKADIFNKAVRGARTVDLAKEYGVSKDLIEDIKYDPKRIQAAKEKLDAHQEFMRLRIHDGANKGIEKEHEILDRKVPAGAKGVGLLYLQHQVATSFMDRDGLKAPDKLDQRFEFVFNNGNDELGMPDESTEVVECDEDNI